MQYFSSDISVQPVDLKTERKLSRQREIISYNTTLNINSTV